MCVYQDTVPTGVEGVVEVYFSYAIGNTVLHRPVAAPPHSGTRVAP